MTTQILTKSIADFGTGTGVRVWHVWMEGGRRRCISEARWISLIRRLEILTPIRHLEYIAASCFPFRIWCPSEMGWRKKQVQLQNFQSGSINSLYVPFAFPYGTLCM